MEWDRNIFAFSKARLPSFVVVADVGAPGSEFKGSVGDAGGMYHDPV